MKDRSDELSTADLAGQSAGSAAHERAVSDEPADRTGERPDGSPGDRDPDSGYAESRNAYAVDRAYADDHPYADDGGAADDRAAFADDSGGGIGSRGPVGGAAQDDPVAADDAAVASDRADVAGDRAGYTNHTAMPADRTGADDAALTGDPTGYADNAAMPAVRTGADDAAVSGDRTGYAGNTATSAGSADDAALSAGVGSAGDGSTLTTAGSGSVVEDGGGYGGAAGMTGERSGYGGTAGNGVAGHKTEPLLGSADSEQFRARWTDVQTGFVDEPRRAVEQADGLTAELMQHLARSFADERLRLERQWDSGEDIPTDDLRTAFQRYRSFFERLLST